MNELFRDLLTKITAKLLDDLRSLPACLINKSLRFTNQGIYSKHRLSLTYRRLFPLKMKTHESIPLTDPDPKINDKSVIETNNSSIVSKRSVERLYLLNESHFFRHFVRKPKRRSPLINRGYWLRMKAISNSTREFLEFCCQKQKVVVNLGCGYDPLPWKCMSSSKTPCKDTIFVDVDHRSLMLRKRKIVQDTPELYSMLTGIKTSEGQLLLRSDQYLQIGCDLRDLAQLVNIFSSILDLENCMVYFIAEVSLAYMNVEAADNLIKWASTMSDAKFCLLEQILPSGINHAFAQTMMAHFRKLSSPLGAVSKYHSLASQKSRFKHLGWPNVFAQNLWEFWASNESLSPTERIALDSIEPFDEWEDFALFANHYFLLTASTKAYGTRTNISPSKFVNTEAQDYQMPEMLDLKAAYSWCQRPIGCRRFAAPLLVKSGERTKDRIALFGGLGFTTRLNSRDEYTSSDLDNSIQYSSFESAIPASRMCHTITDLDNGEALLVGGRASPNIGLSDCWIYHKFLDIWERVDDLPWPLYRHQALKIGQNAILVSNGRIKTSKISDAFLFWSRRTGWIKCEYAGIAPSSVYGPVFLRGPGNEVDKESGILAGGMSLDGVVADEAWRWVLAGMVSQHPTIEFQRLEPQPKLCRFGACCVTHLGNFYLFGGIIKGQLLDVHDQICCFEIAGDNLVRFQALSMSELSPKSLLIGSSVVSMNEAMIVIGGFSVCFSFGTHSNEGCITLTPKTSANPEKWRFLQTVEAKTPFEALEPRKLDNICITSISRIRLESEAHFTEVLRTAKPVIFEGLEIGPCVSKWNMEYLVNAIGYDREVTASQLALTSRANCSQVKVHEATSEFLSFTAKNFKYGTMKFGEFLTQTQLGAKLYLRSLSDKPSLLPANISKDFPSLCSDFILPPELSFVKENFHSSPLRISGPVIVWLHYDTLANVLCQIKGSKRVLLFHPSDARYFDFEPGKSSSSTNVFQILHDRRKHPSQPYEAVLKPGDVIYIPPFWLHTVSTEPETSVAVNVFFRNFSTGYAIGKDIYGNRDMHVYEKGRQDITRIVASFDSLAPEAREFYLHRLLDEFRRKIPDSTV